MSPAPRGSSLPSRHPQLQTDSPLPLALIMHSAAIMHFGEVHDRREVHDQRETRGQAPSARAGSPLRLPPPRRRLPRPPPEPPPPLVGSAVCSSPESAPLPPPAGVWVRPWEPPLDGRPRFPASEPPGARFSTGSSCRMIPRPPHVS